MDISFTSDEAKLTNKLIFETIYHAAVEMSNELAMKRTSAMKTIRQSLDNDYITFDNYDDKCCTNIRNLNGKEMSSTIRQLINEYKPIYHETLNLREDHLGSYSTFTDSPASNGELQFDLWGCYSIRKI